MASETPGPLEETAALSSYLQKQRFLQRLNAASEDEMASRLQLARDYHSGFVAIASKFMNLLEHGAEEARITVDMLAHDHSPLISSPSRQHPQRASSARRNYAISEESRAESTPRRAATPNKIVVVPPGNYGTGLTIVGEVELTGAPQAHRKEVALQRIQNDRAFQAKTLTKFEENENRRRDAYLRKEAQLMALRKRKTQLGADKIAHEARHETEMMRKREIIRGKHDTLEKQRILDQLKKQATADAIRRVDYLAQEAVEDERRRLLESERVAAHKAHQVSLHTAEFCERVRSAASLVKNEKTRRREDFERLFRAENASVTQAYRKREHAACAAHAKATNASTMVEVSWPKDIGEKRERGKNAPIDETSYARLCGFRSMVERSAVADITPEAISRMKHVPPKAWSLLHTVDPNAAFLALQGAQAEVVRGPQHVQWK